MNTLFIGWILRWDIHAWKYCQRRALFLNNLQVRFLQHNLFSRFPLFGLCFNLHHDWKHSSFTVSILQYDGSGYTVEVKKLLTYVSFALCLILGFFCMLWPCTGSTTVQALLLSSLALRKKNKYISVGNHLSVTSMDLLCYLNSYHTAIFTLFCNFLQNSGAKFFGQIIRQVNAELSLKKPSIHEC